MSKKNGIKNSNKNYLLNIQIDKILYLNSDKSFKSYCAGGNFQFNSDRNEDLSELNFFLIFKVKNLSLVRIYYYYYFFLKNYIRKTNS